MVLPGVINGCENWPIKKAEHQRIDAFELRCWKRLLRVPWTAQRSNRSILKVVNLEYSLKDWYWSWWNSSNLATDVKSQLIAKDPNNGKDWRQKEKGATKNEMVDGITDSMDMSLSKLQQTVKVREAWSATVHGVTKGQTGLNDWTTTTTHQETKRHTQRCHDSSEADHQRPKKGAVTQFMAISAPSTQQLA